MRNVIRDIEGDLLDVDDRTKSIAVINSLHRLRHQKRGFGAFNIFRAVANGAHADIVVSVGENSEYHMLFHHDMEGQHEFFIYKDPDLSANGAAILPKNFNWGGSDTAAGLNIYHTPNITDVGELRHQEIIFAGTGGGAIGSEFTSKELIICCNQTALVRIQNTSGQPRDIGAIVEIYQVHLDGVQ